MSLRSLFKTVVCKCEDVLRRDKSDLAAAIVRDDWETAGRILQKNKRAAVWDYETIAGGFEKPIHMAAQSGAVQVLTILLHPHIACAVDTRNSHGSTPLMMAMMNGQDIAAKLLLAKGADIHAESSCGFTPLFCAIAGGHVPLVDLALSKGAALDEAYPDGDTPLTRAVRAPENLPVLKFLLDKGADPNGGTSGIAILTQCLHFPNPDGLRMLLDRGAHIDLSDSEGCVTLLNWAVMANQPDIVTTLLERGLDPMLPNVCGKTSFDIARESAPAALASIQSHIAQKEAEARNRLIDAEVRQLNAGLPEKIAVKTLRLLKPA